MAQTKSAEKAKPNLGKSQREAVEHNEADNPSFQPVSSSSKSASDGASEMIGKMEKAQEKLRARALKSVQDHRERHTQRVEEADAAFRRVVGESFQHYKESEAYFDKIVTEFITAAMRDIEAVDVTVQNVVLHLDGRHGQTESCQLKEHFKQFEDLLHAQAVLLERAARQRGPINQV